MCMRLRKSEKGKARDKGRKSEGGNEKEKKGASSPTLPRWCSATVKILFLADNAETRPNEIAIAPANVCIIKK